MTEGEVVFYLLSLPPITSSWTGEERRAFRELMGAIKIAVLAPCIKRAAHEPRIRERTPRGQGQHGLPAAGEADGAGGERAEDLRSV